LSKDEYSSRNDRRKGIPMDGEVDAETDFDDFKEYEDKYPHQKR
jgi:hypothetical protein